MDVAAMLDPVVSELDGEPAVQAAAIVGSHASGFAHSHSDVDLFVYVDSSPEKELDMRRRLAASLADPNRACRIEERGPLYADVWAVPGGGAYLDLMFWSQSWAEEELDWRLVRHARQMGGASTAFWRSIRDGIPIFDRTGWLSGIRQRARAPYPDELRQTILRDGLDLTGHSNPFSFLLQLERAVAERDPVAAQRCSTRWLEAFFDVLFAANRVLHPGEKRLVQFAQSECAVVPPCLNESVARLVGLAAETSPAIAPHMERMYGELLAVVEATASATE